jgi:DnaJ homolog subfamily C member 6
VTLFPQTVIWPDSRWKQIGLGDVLTPNQVKLAYRKAMLVVHTDKLSKLDVEKKFIGKRIFEAINEAYSEFLEKEDV